jgi:hypothetical protein
MRIGRYIVHRRFADGIRATIGQRQIWRFCIPEIFVNPESIGSSLEKEGAWHRNDQNRKERPASVRQTQLMPLMDARGR